MGNQSFESYKAPCTEGIYPTVLQKGLGILPGLLTKGFRASITLRYVPQAWRVPKVVFIPKPDKYESEFDSNELLFKILLTSLVWYIILGEGGGRG
jgi:hypothetical protein